MNYLVTGASSGIGRATTICLLKSGANVLGLGRDKDKVSELLNEFPQSFQFSSIDLGQRQIETQDILDFIKENGKLNGFVSCAGKEETLPLTLYSEDRIESIFNINLFSPFQILKTISKKKFSEDGASFVFISSVMGELGQPGKTGYCSSKSAILGLVRSAALELASRKIRVNAISPGVVKTPMTEKLFEQIGEDGKKKVESMHPLGFGELTDVIPLIEFLLSDGSKWLTGQNIKIDGGYSVQ